MRVRATTLPAPRRVRRSRRRGAELVEFAMIFPVFLFLFFGIMEYSWYFFQRGAVVEATRLGCQAASQQDPEADEDASGTADFLEIARMVINTELGRQAGVRCAEAGVFCDITIVDMHSPPNDPPRLTCTTTVNFRSLTGFLGSDADPGGAGSKLAETRFGLKGGERRMLPQFIVGRSSMIFEGAD